MKKIFLNWVFLLAIFFAAEEVLGQNQTISSQEDLKADSLRPKVEYTAVISKTPFFNYLKEELKKLMKKQAAKFEEEKITYIPNFVVQGIIWGGDLPLAIINNKVLKIGDAIDEAVIEKIDKNGVTVSANGKVFKLGSPSAMQTNNAAKN